MSVYLIRKKPNGHADDDVAVIMAEDLLEVRRDIAGHMDYNICQATILPSSLDYHILRKTSFYGFIEAVRPYFPYLKWTDLSSNEIHP